MNLGYYPGCSLHATSREFDESLRAVAAAAGHRADEIDDWSCCGATSAHATNHLLGVALPARNLALAEEQGLDEVARALRRLLQPPGGRAPRARPRTRRWPARVAGDPRAPVRQHGDRAQRRRGAARAGAARSGARRGTSEPLAGHLKVACLLRLPAGAAGGGHGLRRPRAAHLDGDRDRAPAAPRRSTGTCASECCGGGFSLSPHRLGGAARPRDPRATRAQAGAEAIVVACPMCHSNLDFRQAGHGAQRRDARCRSSIITSWSAWRSGSARETLGLDRHFVEHAAAAGRGSAAAARRSAKAARRRRRRREADGAHRRIHLPLRREHRPHGGLRRAWPRRCGELPGVVHAVDYKYMCSDPGQTLIKQAIAEHKLDRRGRGRLLAAHAREDLPPRRGRRRPQPVPAARWPTSASTARGSTRTARRPRAKAIDLVRMIVEKVKRNRAAAADPHPGRPSARWSSAAASPASRPRWTSPTAATRSSWSRRSPPSAATWPALARPSPRWTARSASSRRGWSRSTSTRTSRCMTYSEVEAVEGYIGNFKVTIRKKARYVDDDQVHRLRRLPEEVPQQEDPQRVRRGPGQAHGDLRALPAGGAQHAGDRPRATARCFKARPRACKDVCGKCRGLRPRGAIDFDQQDDAGHGEGRRDRRGHRLPALHDRRSRPAASRATASTATARSRTSSTGCSSSGWPRPPARPAARSCGPPTARSRKTVVFLQCVGSPRRAKGIEYCSKICCMYTAKHTMLYQHKVHDGQAIVFYMDVRAGGQGLRGVRPPRHRGGRRPLPARPRVAALPRRRRHQGARRRHPGRRAGGDRRRHGGAGHGDAARSRASRRWPRSSPSPTTSTASINEAHPKLRPVETNTAGVFLAGACQAPRDIPDSVAHGQRRGRQGPGAVLHDELEREPIVARVDDATCTGCFHCERVCPYGAIEHKEIRDRKGNLLKVVAEVNQGVCQGCGTCQATCPSQERRAGRLHRRADLRGDQRAVSEDGA